VAGTTDAIEVLLEALQDAAEVVAAHSVNEALAHLDAGEFDTIACNVRFDESRMFEFLQAVMERHHGRAMRIVSFRAERAALRPSTRSAIRNALEALGVERFVDLSQLRAEYGWEVAMEALRKIVLDGRFDPPEPTGK
jgi:DNA-binding NtrC family response regulator